MQPILTEFEQEAFWQDLLGYIKNDALVAVRSLRCFPLNPTQFIAALCNQVRAEDQGN